MKNINHSIRHIVSVFLLLLTGSLLEGNTGSYG